MIYSGTMAAAFEGAMAGIPSVGFSLLDYDHQAPLEHLAPFIEQVIDNVMQYGLPANVCLNVNFPAEGDQKPIRGMKLCRQALGYWKEEFDERKDPHHQPYFWLHGEFICTDEGTDTDLTALENRFISIVPVHFDFTAHHAFASLPEWNGILAHNPNPATHEVTPEK
ncbi:MAG TPA: 5'/3'-nucleotidase SurE [Bacteroidales bacterium]|nr:5'/3'-nucleotidase SurE [Bacteroidales bacterium]